MSSETNIKQMVKEEVDKYLKELGFPVKEEKVGFEDDEIFLLSIEEYEKYKDIIPHINHWCWLRSQGSHCLYASGVYGNGGVNDIGSIVDDMDAAIRPVIKLDMIGNDYIHGDYEPGDRVIMHSFPWIYLGDDIAIAEVPIAFDMFDEQNNQYSTSKVRDFLNQWLNVRKLYC